MTKAGGRDEHTAFTFPILLVGSGSLWMLHKGFSKTNTDHTDTQLNPFSFVPTKEHMKSSDIHKKLLIALYVQ